MVIHVAQLALGTGLAKSLSGALVLSMLTAVLSAGVTALASTSGTMSRLLFSVLQSWNSSVMASMHHGTQQAVHVVVTAIVMAALVVASLVVLVPHYLGFLVVFVLGH